MSHALAAVDPAPVLPACLGGLADLEVAELAQGCVDAVLAGYPDRARPGPDITVDTDVRAAITLLGGDLRVDALDPLEDSGAVPAAELLQRDIGQDRQQPVLADLLHPGPCQNMRLLPPAHPHVRQRDGVHLV